MQAFIGIEPNALYPISSYGIHRYQVIAENHHITDLYSHRTLHLNTNYAMYETMVIDVSAAYPNQGLGPHKFKYMPRVGEWIEIHAGNTATMFAVVMVAHSGTGSDLYVERLREPFPEAVAALASR